MTQNPEKTTIRVEKFKSNIRPHWKLRLKHRWLRLCLGKRGRALADELERRIEVAFLFGEEHDEHGR